MSPELNSVVRTALPSKDGPIYMETTIGEFLEIGRMNKETQGKYKGTEGFLEALRIIRDR